MASVDSPPSARNLSFPLSLSLLHGSASSSGGIQPHHHLPLPSLILLCLGEVGQAGAHGKGRLQLLLRLRRGRRGGRGRAAAAGGGRPQQRRHLQRVSSPPLLPQDSQLMDWTADPFVLVDGGEMEIRIKHDRDAGRILQYH